MIPMVRIHFVFFFFVICFLFHAVCIPLAGKDVKRTKNRYAVKRVISAAGGKSRCFYLSNGMVPSQKTFFTLNFDETQLYITATCFFPEGEKIRIGGKKTDDSGIFSGDCAEIFLSPRPGSGIYYQFAFSPNGTFYTAQGHDRNWEPAGWRKQVRMEKDRWILETALPYSIFGIQKPTGEEAWGFNFCRTYAPEKGDSERADWVGLADSHCLQDFGKLIFHPLKAKPQIFLEDFSLSPAGRIKTCFSMDNMVDPVVITIRCGEKEYKKEYPPCNETMMELHCDFPKAYLPLKEVQKCVFLGQNARTGERCFSHELSVPGTTLNFLQVNQYYYVPSDKKIRYTLQFDDKFPKEENPVFEVSLIYHGKVLQKHSSSCRGDFSLKGLNPGRYVIEANNGLIRTTRVLYYLSKYDPVSGMPKGTPLKVRGKVFMAEEKPVFLLGGSPTDKPFPEEISFNLIAGNFGTAPNSVKIENLVGRKYNYKDFFCYLYPEKQVFFDSVRENMKDREHQIPGFIRMTYEAQVRTCFQGENGVKMEVDSVEWHKELYHFLRKEFPDDLYSLQTDHPDYIPQLAPYCDIFEVTAAGGYAQDMMPQLIESMPETFRIAGEKPVITWLGATIPNNTCRFAEELRAAVFLNIIHDGAGAIFHLGHGALPKPRTRMWSIIKHLNGEIQAFYPKFRSMPLLDQKTAEKIVRAEGSHYISVIRGNDRDAVLVVLNLLPVENILTFQVNKAFSFGDRFGEIQSCPFVWKSTPYEAAVFFLRRRTVSQNQE